MNKILTTILAASFAGNIYTQQSFTVCPGTIHTISVANTQNLSGPAYTLEPGGISSLNGAWTVTVNTSSTYTMYISGTDSTSNFVTQSFTAFFSVKQVPQLSTVQSPQNFTLGCGVKSMATINITTASPSSASVIYTITPAGITPAGNSTWQTSTSFTVDQAGNYKALAAYPGLPVCHDSVPFTVLDNKVSPVFHSITPATPKIPCFGDVDQIFVAISHNGSSLTAEGPSGMYLNGNSLWVLQGGDYTVSATNDTTGCVADTIITVLPANRPKIKLKFPPVYQLCDTPSILITVTTTATYSLLQWRMMYGNPTICTGTSCVIDQIGNYEINVKDEQGCEGNASFYVVGCVGVNEFDQTQFNTWPNPVVDILHFEDVLLEDAQIFDIAARIVKSVPAMSRNVYLGDLPPGVYLLVTRTGRAKLLKE